MLNPIQYLEVSDYIEVDGLRVGACMWRSKVEEVEQLRARVAELEDLIRYAQVESGVCMCGEDIQTHNQRSGHSPVDIWDHARGAVLKSSTSKPFILHKQAEAIEAVAEQYTPWGISQKYTAFAVSQHLEAEAKRLSNEADTLEKTEGTQL
jgi:hypothetical protein